MFRDLVEDLDGYSPKPGKLLDVPFVPTDQRVLDAMLEMADIGPNDVLYDLGSGDGRIVIEAARRHHIRAIGIEVDPLRIADAMEAAGDARVEFLVDFIEEDLFDADVSEASVVTLYLLESINAQLRPQLLKALRPGSRIVSHAFHMGDWEADQTLELGGICVYKWVVPAQVAGNWEWEASDGALYHVELEQHYQEVTGQAWRGDDAARLTNARLCGARLELSIQSDDEKTVRRFTLTFDNKDLPTVLEHDTAAPSP